MSGSVAISSSAYGQSQWQASFTYPGETYTSESYLITQAKNPCKVAHFTAQECNFAHSKQFPFIGDTAERYKENLAGAKPPAKASS